MKGIVEYHGPYTMPTKEGKTKRQKVREQFEAAQVAIADGTMTAQEFNKVVRRYNLYHPQRFGFVHMSPLAED
jgi:hypothetical protein